MSMKLGLVLLLVMFLSACGGSSSPTPTSPSTVPYVGDTYTLQVFVGTQDPKAVFDSPDLDCINFSSQAAAQEFFEGNGGPEEDKHVLDGDNDGIACEKNGSELWYRGRPNKPSVTNPTPNPSPTPTPSPTPSPCCKVCKVGKPCGDTCIAKDKTCTKPRGCACSGSVAGLEAVVLRYVGRGNEVQQCSLTMPLPSRENTVHAP